VEVADIFTTRDGDLVRAQGYPPHADAFLRHGIDLPQLLADRHDQV
jgi:pilus assembly protein CpaF